MSRFRRLSRKLKLAFIGLVTVLLVLGFTVAARASGSDDARYRTARASLGDVTETVSTSGTVDASVRRDIAAATSGTVRRVTVEVGDQVKAGQVLVVLDRAELRRAVRKARATLAQAKVDLADAGTTQESVVQSAATPAASSGSSGSSKPSAAPATTKQSSPATSTASPTTKTPMAPKVDLPGMDEIRSQQEAVKTTQSEASAALSEASAALAAQQNACAQAYGRGDTQPAEGDETSGDQAANDACDAALSAVESAQQTVSEKQAALQSALDTLTDSLAAALEQTETGVTTLQEWLADQKEQPQQSQTQSNQTTTSAQAPTQPSTQTQAQSQAQAQAQNQPRSQSSSQATPQSVAAASAMSVAQGQASVDSAEAELLAAEQDLAAARITSRIAGTVTAVDVATEDTVSTGDVVATVVGKGGATVSLSLSGTTVRKVKAGQTTQVTLPGASASVPGTVTWVSPVASSSSSSPFAQASTYAAEVAVTAKALAQQVLPQGARADVTITLGTATDTLTVPTSALHPSGHRTTVQVIGDEGTAARAVEIGRTGPARTEILDGLSAGDTVVLADLDAEIDAAGEVTSSSTNGMPFPGRRTR